MKMTIDDERLRTVMVMTNMSSFVSLSDETTVLGGGGTLSTIQQRKMCSTLTENDGFLYIEAIFSHVMSIASQ